MVDPIEDDELKRSRRIKQYADYSKQLEKADKEAALEMPGEMQGKKVKKISAENSSIDRLFKRLH